MERPGWPGALPLDPAGAAQAVWVRVTPFGRTGPRAGWRATDLGIVAASGNMHATGYPDRPPLRCTEPTAYNHGGPEIAVAALTGPASGRPAIYRHSKAADTKVLLAERLAYAATEHNGAQNCATAAVRRAAAQLGQSVPAGALT